MVGGFLRDSTGETGEAPETCTSSGEQTRERHSSYGRPQGRPDEIEVLTSADVKSFARGSSGSAVQVEAVAQQRMSMGMADGGPNKSFRQGEQQRVTGPNCSSAVEFDNQTRSFRSDLNVDVGDEYLQDEEEEPAGETLSPGDSYEIKLPTPMALKSQRSGMQQQNANG